MGKHIIDKPRKTGQGDRLRHYTKLDREVSGRPAPQTEALLRAPRDHASEEKLRRFAEIQRRED